MAPKSFWSIENRGLIIPSVFEIFRSNGDRDYILARQAYIFDFPDQFQWMAHSALEKYLKCILAINAEISVEDKHHDLEKLFNRLKDITDIPFKFPESVEKFLKNINRNLGDRYFTQVSNMTEQDLRQLDETVWHIRKYCQNFREPSKDDFPKIDPVLLGPIEKLWQNNTHSPVIFNGLLENIISDLKKISSPLFESLTTDNLFFGSTLNKMDILPDKKMISRIPTHLSEPKIFPELAERIYFPKKTIESFKEKHPQIPLP